MMLERRLADAFLQSHPSEAALVLERMTPELRVAALAEAPAAASGAVLRRMAGPLATEAIARLSPATAASALGALELDAAAALLRPLPADPAARIIEALPAARQDVLRRALSYPDATAGALADPDVLSIPAEISVAEARLRLRRAPRHLLYYLYVVDRDQRLVGVLDIPELLHARARDEVQVAMHHPVDSLPALAPASVVRTHPGWRAFHAMPVVDDDGRLIGAIRYRTLRRLERDAQRAGAQAPASVTVMALGELFHLGIAGLVEGVAATTMPRAAGGHADSSAPRPAGEGAHD